METKILPFTNADKTQVDFRYYYGGRVIEETVYSLIDEGIKVDVLPSSGWKSGVYVR